MSKQDNLKDYLTDLANTIRTKKDYPNSQKLNPQDFSDEVLSIESGKPTLFPAIVIGGYNQISWVTDPRNGSFAVTTSAKLDGVDIVGDTLTITAEDADKHLVITSSAEYFEPAVVDILIYYMSAQSSLISISDGGTSNDYGLCVEISDTDILVPQGYVSTSGNKYYSAKSTTDSEGQASGSLSFSVAAISSERPSAFKLSVVDADNKLISANVAWTINKNGVLAYSGTTFADDAEISIPSEVTWEAGDDIEFIVNVSQVVLSRIYGVSWVNDDSTTMTRTDDAVGMADPTFSSEDDGIECTSPFDNVFPWSEARKEVIDGNVMMHMPEMWFRVETDPNAPSEIVSVAVSNKQGNSGHWYNVKSFYYSCYGGSLSGSTLKSVSGVARADGATRTQFRGYVKANGFGYTQLDLYHNTVMLFLWWIEFATKNPRSIANGAFRGVIKDSGTVGGTQYKNTGGTDGLSTPTGIEWTRYQMRWHYIEDFVGNKYNWVDGVVHGSANNPAYVTSDSSKYTDDSSDMSATSYKNPLMSGKCIMAFGWDSAKPFLMMPTRSVENSNWDIGFSNAANFGASNVLCVGANAAGSDLNRGVCYFYSDSVSYTSTNFGARLIKSTL